MEVNFCRRCGTKLTAKGPGAYVCQKGHHIFEKAAPAACVLLLNEFDEALIAIRGQEPSKGMYDLPGGFCDTEESYEEAAIRELQEETGLLPGDYSDLVYLGSGIDHYMYEGEQGRVMGVAFWARIKGDMTLKANDDVAELVWEPLDSIDLTKIADGFNVVRNALITMQERLGLRD